MAGATMRRRPAYEGPGVSVPRHRAVWIDLGVAWRACARHSRVSRVGERRLHQGARGPLPVEIQRVPAILGKCPCASATATAACGRSSRIFRSASRSPTRHPGTAAIPRIGSARSSQLNHLTRRAAVSASAPLATSAPSSPKPMSTAGRISSTTRIATSSKRSGPSGFPSICVRNCITAPIVWDSDTADGSRAWVSPTARSAATDHSPPVPGIDF